jgi:hypothetical protein
MLGTAIAQLRFVASIALGRPFPLWALDRLIAAVQDTQRELGAHVAIKRMGAWCCFSTTRWEHHRHPRPDGTRLTAGAR